MIRLRAGAVGFAAAAIVLADRAAPEVAGLGQLPIEPVPLRLQIVERRIRHPRASLSGCLYHNQTIAQPGSIPSTYIRVAHPDADPHGSWRGSGAREW